MRINFMRLGNVIGTVTLNRSHPSLAGARFVLTVPLSLANLLGDELAAADELVVYDDLGADSGSCIAFSEGGEAAQPFFPNMKQVDAYNAALIDQLDLQRDLI
jgi:ethanolamine utilization protein EutN